MTLYTKDWKPSEFKLKERYWATLPGHEDDPRVIRVESVGKLKTGEHGLVIDELGYSYTFESMKSLGVKLGPRIDPPREDAKDDCRCAVCGWPLAATAKDGCVRGNCSKRPRPKRLYDEERAHREGCGRFYQDITPTQEIRIPVAVGFGGPSGEDFVVAWRGESGNLESTNSCESRNEFREVTDEKAINIITVTARIPIPSPQPDIEVEGEVRDA